jgi:hypothetical protein
MPVMAATPVPVVAQQVMQEIIFVPAAVVTTPAAQRLAAVAAQEVVAVKPHTFATVAYVASPHLLMYFNVLTPVRVVAGLVF